MKKWRNIFDELQEIFNKEFNRSRAFRTILSRFFSRDRSSDTDMRRIQKLMDRLHTLRQSTKLGLTWIGFYENVDGSSWQNVTNFKESAWQPSFYSFCQGLRPMAVNLVHCLQTVQTLQNRRFAVFAFGFVGPSDNKCTSIIDSPGIQQFILAVMYCQIPIPSKKLQFRFSLSRQVRRHLSHVTPTNKNASKSPSKRVSIKKSAGKRKRYGIIANESSLPDDIDSEKQQHCSNCIRTRIKIYIQHAS